MTTTVIVIYNSDFSYDCPLIASATSAAISTTTMNTIITAVMIANKTSNYYFRLFS